MNFKKLSTKGIADSFRNELIKNGLSEEQVTKVFDSLKTLHSSDEKALYKLLDSVLTASEEEVDSDATQFTDDEAKQRAAKVEEYSNDLTLLLSDNVTSAQDIIQTLDSVLEDDEATRRHIEKKLSEEFDVAESLDNTIWDYVQHMELDPVKVVGVISSDSEIDDEIFVILVDDILG